MINLKLYLYCKNMFELDDDYVQFGQEDDDTTEVQELQEKDYLDRARMRVGFPSAKLITLKTLTKFGFL